jgi:dolichol-phosphate mannosyltransferase
MSPALTTAQIGAFSLGLFLLQLPCAAILLSRLLSGARRQPPLSPIAASAHQAQIICQSVSVIVPTLNEAHRIQPCLAGLSQQGDEVREIIVIDSHSQDGTPEQVSALAQQDLRIRLITDDPPPPQWVGRPWALHNGFLASSPQSTWILGIDADTQPQSGLVATLITTAEQQHYDLISLSPRFKLISAAEWWLQPALLITLIYRFDSAGVDSTAPERVMANGQCFLCRRQVLTQLNGYSRAAGSFCDDVTLARVAAQAGFKVGFLDGSRLISVRMYEGARETWQGWGRSLDLKDAATPAQLWGDLGFLIATQALPLLVVLSLWVAWLLGYGSLSLKIAIALNLLLLIIRCGMQSAIITAYHRPQKFFSTAQLFWLSPLADPLAVLRIFLSTFQQQIKWRGRTYQRAK